MTHLRLPRAIALSLTLFATLTSAQQTEEDIHGHEHDEKTLDAVVIVGSRQVSESADQLNAPVEVLQGEALEHARAGTLGETLRGLAGVQSTSFGQAVSRPVIRGLDGPRVLVAQGGISAMDVSSLSPDHAVTIEPFLADRIDILKGPAALLYGSGAIGGIVNVEDGRLPTTLPEKLSGRAQLQYGNNADEHNAVLRLDAPLNRIALHFDAFDRSADAYEGRFEEIANSQIDTRGAAVGAGIELDNSVFALGISRYENNYGIPNEEAVIDMAQTRFDALARIDFDSFIEAMEVRGALNNYRHLELEGDEIGTRFDNDESQLRISARHQAVGPFTGAIGANFERKEVAAVGEEAFVPTSETKSNGVFLYEQFDTSDAFELGFGLRADRTEVETVNGDRRTFNTPSASISGSYNDVEYNKFKISLDLATRAPQAEELYADGPHIATQAFEIGDESLRTERSKSINLGWHVDTELLDFKLEAYHTRFDRFIYLEGSDQIEDDLPVFFWRQRNARFNGVDFSAQWHALETDAQSMHIGFLADRVGARFDNGDAVPRLSPMRFGASFDWHLDALQFHLKGIRALQPRNLAENETNTPSYTQFDLDIQYEFDVQDHHWEAYLQGRNITNEDVRLHTSFLKDSAPLPGRDVRLGLRWKF